MRDIAAVETPRTPEGEEAAAGKPAAKDDAADRGTAAEQQAADRTATDRTATDQQAAGADRDLDRPATGHTGYTTGSTTATATAAAPEAAPGADVPGRLGRRMEHAIGGFVDDPRRAVREADDVLQEAIKYLEQVVEDRRTALRTGVKDGADTEDLRVALTRYRDLTDQLLAL